MQNPEILNNFPTSEMEFYRYMAGCNNNNNNNIIGEQANDVVLGMMMMNNNNNYSGFGGYNHNHNHSNYSSISSCSSGLMREAPVMEMETKAIMASRVLHKEAEKRRRERINSHLDRLRSLLPCTSKTDKATLLSKVVQRVLELKRQTTELLELDSLTIPSENDEFAVYIHDNNNNNDDDNGQCLSYDEEQDDLYDGDGNGDGDRSNRLVLRASLCCEDRPDLFTDLNQVLSSLNLKTLRAEISTLGGRIQGVLVVSSDDESKCRRDECAVFLRDALKGIVQRSSGVDDRLKRRRRVFESGC